MFCLEDGSRADVLLVGEIALPNAAASNRADGVRQCTDTVYVVIPGNPGNVRFYREFATAMHATTGTTVAVLGHTGHSVTSEYGFGAAAPSPSWASSTATHNGRRHLRP